MRSREEREEATGASGEGVTSKAWPPSSQLLNTEAGIQVLHTDPNISAAVNIEPLNPTHPAATHQGERRPARLPPLTGAASPPTYTP